MKIAVIGYDRQGRSAFEYWNKSDNELTICDRNPQIDVPKNANTQLGENYLNNLDRFDLIIRTPGLHPRTLVEAAGEGILNKVHSVTNEFLKVCPTKNIIGVTGTKGKGTTSTLVAKLLEAGGYRTHLGGNIGIAPLELLKNNIQPDDWVVLELANFQLIDLKYSPHIAVCLMVQPEHLDWHGTTEEYYQAKSQLFMNQSAEDKAIYFALNEVSKQIASSGKAQLIPYFSSPGAFVLDDKIVIDNQPICSTNEVALIGKHNWENVCAAVTAVWQVHQKTEQIKNVLTSFSGLPFRIQPVATKNNIRFYNDSFASQPSATIAAMKAIPGKKVLIIGGRDRNLDLGELVGEINRHNSELRKVLIIGEAADRIAVNLYDAGFSNYVVSKTKQMPALLNEALSLAEPGDAIVLSPGFPSFDMFKNFEERGELFNLAVSNL